MRVRLERVRGGMIFCGLIPFLGFRGLVGGRRLGDAKRQLAEEHALPHRPDPGQGVLVSQCTQVVGTGLLLVAIRLARQAHLVGFASAGGVGGANPVFDRALDLIQHERVFP